MALLRYAPVLVVDTDREAGQVTAQLITVAVGEATFAPTEVANEASVKKTVHANH